MGIRNKLRQFHRRNLAFGYYPGSRRSAIIFTLCFTILSWRFNPYLVLDVKPFFDPFLDTNDPGNDLVVHAMVGLFLWVVLATIRKMILRRVLAYRGWMYEGKTPSTKTKLFVVTVRLLCGWTKPLNNSLYDLQNILPALPVPALRETVTQYVGSMRPLVEAAKYLELEAKAKYFLENTGPRLQRYIILKSWLSGNYISDWWEDYIYLKSRGSLLIDSNYYAVDALEETTTDQATRAALLTYSTLKTREAIETNTFEPVIANGIIPLCSWQVERMFNTTRVPGETMDHLQHEEFSNHVIVQHKGRYFRVDVYHNGNRSKLLTPAELRLQFDRILKDKSQPAAGEDKLAALTAWTRTEWARSRKAYFSTGVNKLSLDILEKAAFVINLDEEDHLMECLQKPGKTTADYSEFNRQLLHGNGCNRWMDKSFNFIISKNGRAGGNGEHSWGDAPVGAYMWEINLKYGLEFDDFDEKGLIKSPPARIPPQPTRLEWDLPEECLEDIDAAAKEAWKAIDNLDLKTLVFSNFGKGLMKKCRVSPDAFIQMALQLAYYRDQGKFELTYEASMTRLYLQGRTETVRSCTTESCEWVESMQSGKTSEEKVKLFQRACERHQKSYRLSMSGKGFDRHLFGLYVISKYLKVDEPFLEEALSRPWRLSTSQTPIHQIPGNTHICLGGGFGPVAEDGYGVSYIIAGEDLLYFHLTSKKTASNTDTNRFGDQVERALEDIRKMFAV